jgi:transposase
VAGTREKSELTDGVAERLGAVESLISQLRATLAEREAKIADLTEKNAALQEKLNRDSTNSNLPPSSDGPKKSKGVTTRGRLRGKSGKKQGAQKGHKGAHRSLMPEADVDKFVRLLPPVCSHCSSDDLAQVADNEPRRFQQVDIVDCRRQLTEWQLHALVCRRCDHVTRARYNDHQMPKLAFGPGVIAAVSLMTGRYWLSRRNAQSLLREHFDIVASLGSICAMEAMASKALAPAHSEIHAHVKAAAVVYTDATGWKQRGKLKSVVVLASAEVSAFFILDDGTRETLEPLFDPNCGIMVTDRASIFGFWLMTLRQICWAHIIRKFVSFAEREGPAGLFGKDLLTLATLVFDSWHAFLDGKLDRTALSTWIDPIKIAMLDLLHRAVAANIKRLSGSCKNLLKHADALWNFVVHEGVDPTNNHAERELRPIVIWRKSSFGSKSEAGDRFAERMMSVVQTARKLGRSARDYIIDAIRAQFNSEQAPSLLA